VALHDRDRQVGEALRVGDLGRALERAVDVQGAQVAEVPAGLLAQALLLGGELWHALPTAERTIRCIQHAVGATSTAVTPSPATAVWGQSVVLTATVTNTTTPSTPAGSVQF